MSTATTTRMTADEFWEFTQRPENAGKFLELERGEVVEMPSPGKYHGFVCGNIVARLWLYAGQAGKGYVCSNDSGVLVEQDPDTVRGPDVSFYVDGQTADTMERKYAADPPRLVVEVRSPHDRERKVRQRLAEYLRRGIPMVWLVEPEDRYVTVYEPGKIHLVLDEADDLIGGDVMPGFSCKVADLFSLPRGVQ